MQNFTLEFEQKSEKRNHISSYSLASIFAYNSIARNVVKLERKSYGKCQESTQRMTLTQKRVKRNLLQEDACFVAFISVEWKSPSSSSNVKQKMSIIFYDTSAFYNTKQNVAANAVPKKCKSFYFYCTKVDLCLFWSWSYLYNSTESVAEKSKEFFFSILKRKNRDKSDSFIDLNQGFVNCIEWVQFNLVEFYSIIETAWNNGHGYAPIYIARRPNMVYMFL